MHLNIGVIKSVLTIYDEMLSNGGSLIYLGEFNQDITKMFTSMTEEDMERNQEETKVRRKVYHVLVEILQNMNKHSDELSEHKQVGTGLFMIGRKDENYYVISSNKIKNDRVEPLKELIDTINASSKEELNAMWRTQIKGGSISDRGGAGLGLIDIARKIGQQYEYMFFELEKDEESLFVLKVEVPS